MNDHIKKYIQHQQVPYLDNISSIHQKHSEILTDLMHRPMLHHHQKKIDETMNILYTNRPLLTEIIPSIQKPIPASQQKNQKPKE
ncbi:MAG: hypothetical protein R6V50_05890 [Thermoplasmatota archaeon]